MTYGTGSGLWKVAAALLLALVVSLGTLGVAQATHTLSSNVKGGWYEVGGSAADRILVKGGGVVATWTHVKVNLRQGTWMYWTIENTSSSPQRVGCKGYQSYGLEGYKVRGGDHTGHDEFTAKDAKCVHLGGAHRQMLQPGQTITSWAAFDYVWKKGNCLALTLPTGPNVPEHVGYTKCVDPYARYLGPSGSGPPSGSGSPSGSTGKQFEFPWDSSKTGPLAYTGGPHAWTDTTNERSTRSGLDFSDGSASTHILAMADGTVTHVGLNYCIDGRKECKIVKVSHDNGWDVWYLHLSSFAPDIVTQCNPKQSGDCSVPVPVKQGRYLGNEGGTGAYGVVHIHIELRKGNTPHEWSEVSGGIEGWEFHRDCKGYDENKAAYDEKKKMSQKNPKQECIAYTTPTATGEINDGYNYDGYMSKGGIHAIPWFGPGAQYWVHSKNHEL